MTIKRIRVAGSPTKRIDGARVARALGAELLSDTTRCSARGKQGRCVHGKGHVGAHMPEGKTVTIFRTTYHRTGTTIWSELKDDREFVLATQQTGDPDVQWKAGTDVRVCRAVECEHCQVELYRTDGRAVLAPFGGGMTELRVTMTVANMILCFCSRDCAVSWLRRQPEDQLCGGYPLF